MPRNSVFRDPKFAAAALVALACLVGIVVILFGLRGDGDSGDAGDRAEGFFATSPAGAPFGRFTEARVARGDRCLRVLVADTYDLRVQGLRDARDLGPYAGMLFVWPEDTRTRFTMADTPTPLDIGWYAADGTEVDRTTMVPCPDGDDASCPKYESREPYRYALETPAGSGAPGSVGACA